MTCLNSISAFPVCSILTWQQLTMQILLLLENMFLECVHMCECMCACVCTWCVHVHVSLHMHVHVVVTDVHRAFSSIIAHFVLWDSISHWTRNLLILLDCLVSKTPKTSCPDLSLSMYTSIPIPIFYNVWDQTHSQHFTLWAISPAHPTSVFLGRSCLLSVRTQWGS